MTRSFRKSQVSNFSNPFFRRPSPLHLPPLQSFPRPKNKQGHACMVVPLPTASHPAGSAPRRLMDAMPQRIHRCLADRLGQRRVGMHRFGQIRGCQAHLHCQPNLRHQIGR